MKWDIYSIYIYILFWDIFSRRLCRPLIMCSITGLCFESIRTWMLAVVSFILSYVVFWVHRSGKRILNFWAVGRNLTLIGPSYMHHHSGFPLYWNSMSSFQKHRGNANFCLLYPSLLVQNSILTKLLSLLYYFCSGFSMLVLALYLRCFRPFYMCLIHLVLSAK